MKDINTLTGFQGDWRAVLDFLTGIPMKKIREIIITKQKQEWKVNVQSTAVKKPKTGAGLYDLYW